MKFDKVPITLEGHILIYTDSNNPSMRSFSTREALVKWVGEWHLRNGRSDDHWVDAVMEGKVTIIDESVKLYSEDQNESERSEEVSGSN